MSSPTTGATSCSPMLLWTGLELATVAAKAVMAKAGVLARGALRAALVAAAAARAGAVQLCLDGLLAAAGGQWPPLLLDFCAVRQEMDEGPAGPGAPLAPAP
eukprot:5741006-Lingulodinium_polyedra.AAC.1